MAISKHSAIVAALTMAFALFQASEADARPGEYVTIPVSVAIAPATAAIIAQSRFLQLNRSRGNFAPHTCVTYYRPYGSYGLSANCYRRGR